jgi:hypothetical protein
MASSTAELTLILRAQNLADAAVGELRTAVSNIGTAAQTAASKFSTAFAGLGNRIANELGNLVVAVLNGQDIGQAALMLGSTLAGGIVSAFGEQIVAKIAGSALIAQIGGALAAAGATIGTIVDAAIGVAMAALPLVLLAAVVAAVVYLANHPEIVGEAIRVAGTIVKGIVDGLAGLAEKIVNLIVAAPAIIASILGPFISGLVNWFLGIPGKLLDLGGSIVTTIINGMLSLPGKVADVIRDAFSNLKIDVGPFHIRSTGITIDLPNLTQDPRFAGQTYAETHFGQHAAGGWAGLKGPELSLLGEKGPEYVIPHDQLRSPAPSAPRVIQLVVDGRMLAEVIDEHQYRLGQRLPART